MTTSGFKKFRLLLWKNYLLQKRHRIQTLFEILLPLIFILLLVLIRMILSSDVIEDGKNFPPWSPTNYSATVIEPHILQTIDTEGEWQTNLKIYYAPANLTETEAVMKMVEGYFSFPYYDKNNVSQTMNYTLMPFEDEAALITAYRAMTEPLSLGILGGVVFTKWENGNFEYKLRFPAKMKKVAGSDTQEDEDWQTSLLFPIFQLLGPRLEDDIFGGIPGYHSQGFTLLQYAVDRSIMSTVANIDPEEYEIYMQRFPYPKYIDDNFIVALQGWLPLMLWLSFIYPVINITKSIVVEKEKRLKESMKMMGLPNYLHWSAWFLKSFVFLVVSTIFMVVLVKVKWYGNGLAVLTYADGTVIFLFFLGFVFTTIMLAFLVSSLCSKANSAATAAGVVWFVSYLPYFFLQPRYDQLSQASKVSISILSNTGMAFGCQLISMFEGTGAGTTWSNISSGASPQDDFTMLQCIIILFFDGFLYFLLAIYIEAVWPGEFGVPLPWYFPFTKSYWVDTSGENYVSNSNGASNNNNNNGNFETPPSNGKAGIQIKGLTKQFNKKKIAVNNLSLDMYQDQITALLGHNGAGKTTTMSMLTGFLVPSSGTAIINNFDIRKNIKEVRDNLGLCPQHDVLFDELTVEEHLRFFCLMKGYPHVDTEIDRMIAAVGLEPKRHAQSSTLSGGMKRKLSVAIALVGGSKVVLLDEPTSGMDPGARRSTWDLLTSEKKGRTILLSTHFMNEADLLGDRIAIMADGQLQTVGSSLFLKKRYGGGYHLIIVKEDGCDVPRITEILRKHLGEATVEQDVGAELSYSLPDNKSSLFGDLFEELESRRRELKIDSYGASITTMEEVFMRVGKEAEEKKYKSQPSLNISVEALQSNSNYKLYADHQEKNKGVTHLLQQLRAMIVKKALYSMRNRLLLFVQTIVPVLFLVIALIMLQTLPDMLQADELTIHANHYGDTMVTISCDDKNDLQKLICAAYKNFSQDHDGASVKNIFDESVEDFLKRAGAADLVDVNYHYLVGMEMNGSETMTAFFNNQPFHAPPITLNYLSNAILMSRAPDARIIASNYPLPFTITEEVDSSGSIGSTGFQIGFNMAFGMSFLAASFVVFLVKERVSKAKHLQYVSGVKFWVFWMAHFFFDAVNFLIPSILSIVALVAFQAETFTSAEVLGATFVLLLFYGWAIIPMMYLFSFWGTIPSSCFTRMWFFNVVTGLGPIVAVSIMQIPSLNLESTGEMLDWLFMILFPNYSLGWGVVTLSKNYGLLQGCPLKALALGGLHCDTNPDDLCCNEYKYGYLAWHAAGIGRYIFFLFMIGVVCFTILFIKESEILSKIFGRRRKEKGTTAAFTDPHEDTDVAAEAKRIRNTNLTQLYKSDNLIIRDVSKSYGSFQAVKCLNLGVQQKECFGLLGMNGAGKTTTFKMLTGDLPVTSGDAFIYSHSINSDIKKVQKNLGYCPQFDAIIEELTGRETIRLFARLRGVKENEIDALVDKLGSNLLFNEHMEKRVGQYSGGNKRKLSTALALVGNPPIVFLDEPTTGMDPVARRHLWNCISNIRQAGTSIVLTSHSMEECEALCTRLAIMVNGEFKCLGSTQHLKSKFGEGYTVIAQMASKVEVTKKSFQESQRRRSSGVKQDWEREIQPLQQYIEDSFPGSVVKDLHPGYVHYHVTNTKLTWGALFRKMEVAKKMFDLEAYSVGQTTLEQVFLNFTKAQVSDE